MRNHGFTLVELIVVMILVGIMAYVVVPRFNGLIFKEKGFHDAVKATVQHARRMAVAGRRFVCINVNSGTGIVEIKRDIRTPEAVASAASISCGDALALPAPGSGCTANNQVCAPSGVTLSGSSLIFDPLGRPVNTDKTVHTAADLSISVSNQPAVTIQPETGFVQ